MSGVASRPTITVLLCTCDRPAMLDRALRRLAAGTTIPDQLVVVNGGGYEANDVVAGHGDSFPQVILLQYRNRNLAASRNLGLARCDGEIIAMTDDDAEVAPDWIERMLEAHRSDPNAGAIGGRVVGRRNERFLSRVADCVVFPASTVRREIHNLPGVNVSYKRCVVERAGSFDERLFRGEDVDFNQRVSKLGYSLVFEPGIVVAHEHRPTLRALLAQQYMYGRAYVLVRAKHGTLYCVYPRRLSVPRDWLKLIHCALAVFYQPVLAARRMPSWPERLAAIPVLIAHHAIWKLGMLRQLLQPDPRNARQERAAESRSSVK